MPKQTEKKQKQFKPSMIPIAVMIIMVILTGSFLVVGVFYVWYYSSVAAPIQQLAANQQALSEQIQKLDSVTAEKVVEKEAVDEVVLEDEAEGCTYTNEDYNFSISFPETWCDIKVLKEQTTFEDIPGLLYSVRLVAEDDTDRELFIDVGEPRIKGGLYEDLPRIFLTESDDYVYYYSGNMPPYCDWEMLTDRQKERCEIKVPIWEEEIQKQIIPTFKVLEE